MAFGGAKLFKGFGAGKLPPDLLPRSVRHNIQLCWMLQEPSKRSREDIRRVMLDIFENEMRDFESLVNEL
jgi:hypothetical protein